MISYRAIGEIASEENQNSRRVDAYIYCTCTDQKQLKGASGKCFEIDYSLLNASYTYEKTIGRNRYTFIEVQAQKAPENYYYGTFNKKGKLVYEPVEWKGRWIGRKWWAEYRHVAQIPSIAFNANKIFKLSELPCYGCEQQVYKDSLSSIDTSILFIDQFLLRHTQYFLWTRNDEVSVRTPREYLENGYTWFSGCDTSKVLQWKKGRFFWNKHYAYTSLNVLGNRIVAPTRRVTVCEADSLESDCGSGVSFTAQGVKKNLSIMGEIGHLTKDQNEYFTLGIESIGSKSSFGFLVGKYSQGYGGELQARYHFLDIPVPLTDLWRTHRDRRPFKRLLRSYIGSNAFILAEGNVTLDLHIGLSLYNNVSNGIFNRVYLQYNYQVFSTGLTGITGNQLRLGVSMRLLRLKEYK